MQKQKLVLYNTKDGYIRTVIKTSHGRFIYLELGENASKYIVRRCIYLDRVWGGEYYAAPQKLVTNEFGKDDILDIFANQLDRKYYGVEYSNAMSELAAEDFIRCKLNELKRGYKFLILVGEGEMINGLPSTLTTRLANRIHRKIYLKIKYFKNGLGVVDDCFYYDRQYKARTKVVPQMLSSVIIRYNRESIVSMINTELNCDFTHVIITDNSIDFENNTFPLCGNI